MNNNIVLKIRDGDLKILDEIYLEVKPIFISFAKKNFSSIQGEDIDDIYQDSIIIFYQNIRRGVLTEIHSSVSTYIIQIGKIKLIQHSNQLKKTRNVKENLVAKKDDESFYNKKIDDAVQFVFSKMTDSCRQILHLFYFEKIPMDKIALLLNYKNADTVKSKKNRCISTFNSNVSKIYFDE
jgi:RNA polymerase sigma factor (sigma-70 family)